MMSKKHWVKVPLPDDKQFDSFKVIFNKELLGVGAEELFLNMRYYSCSDSFVSAIKFTVQNSASNLELTLFHEIALFIFYDLYKPSLIQYLGKTPIDENVQLAYSAKDLKMKWELKHGYLTR